MSIEGQGHFFTIYFPGFVCFVLYWAKISGEHLQDHFSSGFFIETHFQLKCFIFVVYFSTKERACGFLYFIVHVQYSNYGNLQTSKTRYVVVIS